MALITRRMTGEIFDDINNERERQNQKWGPQDHDHYKWLTIIGEEYGEASTEALEIDFLERRANEDNLPSINLLIKDRKMKLRTELIQVAACVVAFIEQLDREES